MGCMRDMAVRYNQNLLPYPVFGLVYGQSKAGKTSFLETLLKMMIGQKTKLSAPDFTRSSIEGLKRTVKGAPIIVDDLTNTRFNQHAIEAANATGTLLWDRKVLRKMLDQSSLVKPSTYIENQSVNQSMDIDCPSFRPHSGKPISWVVVCLCLYFIHLVGIFLLYKRLSQYKDAAELQKNSRIASIVATIYMCICCVIFIVAICSSEFVVLLALIVPP